MDLGEHVLSSGGSVRIFDVLPAELGCFRANSMSSKSQLLLEDADALDTGRARSNSINTLSTSSPSANADVVGRMFDLPLKTLAKLSPSFWDAPRDEVVLVFMFVQGIKPLRVAQPTLAMSVTDVICQIVRLGLVEHEGYECQEILGAFMLAFKSAANAIHWCCQIHQTLKAVDWPDDLISHQIKKLQEVVEDSDPAKKVKPGIGVACGVQRGAVVDYRPHDKTGRMDYFGPVVNRTARLAASAHEGQTVVGEEAIASPECQDPVFAQTVVTHDYGLHRLKGVDQPQHLYGVSPSPSFFKNMRSGNPMDIAVSPASEFPLPKTLGVVES